MKRAADNHEDEEKEILLTSFNGTSRTLPLDTVFGSCKRIGDFVKLNRLGEGTYGVVCKLQLLNIGVFKWACLHHP